MSLRFLRGGALIGAVIGKVENYIQHLERGIEHCRESRDRVIAQIERLEHEAEEHTQHALRGRAFANKLRELIGDNSLDS